MGGGGENPRIARNPFQLAAFQVFIFRFSSHFLLSRNFPTPFPPFHPPSLRFRSSRLIAVFTIFLLPSSFFPPPPPPPSGGKGMVAVKPVVCSKGRFDLVSQRVERKGRKKKRKRRGKKGRGEKKGWKSLLAVELSRFSFDRTSTPSSTPAATSVNRDCATRKKLVETLIA